ASQQTMDERLVMFRENSIALAVSAELLECCNAACRLDPLVLRGPRGGGAGAPARLWVPRGLGGRGELAQRLGGAELRRAERLGVCPGGRGRGGGRALAAGGAARVRADQRQPADLRQLGRHRRAVR